MELFGFRKIRPTDSVSRETTELRELTKDLRKAMERLDERNER